MIALIIGVRQGRYQMKPTNMKLKQYQVDAFATRVFEGNPAAVCPLTEWLDDDLMQAIAAENNLAETAFFVPHEKAFRLRWFTPVQEVDLCGHATLAAAHVIFDTLGYDNDRIAFSTRSGELFVEKKNNRLEMDFPAIKITRREITERIIAALGQAPVELWSGDDYLAVFDHETTIRNLKPNQLLLSELDLRGVIVTAPGSQFDFVSRFFAPKYGIPEDPVTGSAHCALAPYWAQRLNKASLSARQLSKRGGNVACAIKDDRVLLAGTAITFMAAEIII